MATSARRRRKPTYMRSQSDGQSDGFRPNKSVGLAVAFGLPLMGMGVFALFAAVQDGGTFLWILAPCLIVVGLVTAGSHKII
jgi:hypothetical protein